MHPVQQKPDQAVTNGFDGQFSHYMRRTRRVQKPPYDLVLPHHMVKVAIPFAELHPGSHSFGGMADAGANKSPDFLVLGPAYAETAFPEAKVLARNKARARLNEKINGEVAQLLISLHEKEKSMNMIAARGNQLCTIFRLLIKKRFGDAIALMLGGQGRSLPAKNRDAAKLSLEINFGWSPLLADVNNTLEALIRVPLESSRVYASAKRKDSLRRVTGLGSGGIERFGEQDAVIRIRCACNVHPIDHNVNLLARLGLTNPLSVAWDATPGSFLVDIFLANVSTFLASWTAEHGLILTQQWRTEQVDIRAFGEQRELWSGTLYGWRVRSKSVSFDRYDALPEINLVFKPFIINPFKAVVAWSMASALWYNGARDAYFDLLRNQFGEHRSRGRHLF